MTYTNKMWKKSGVKEYILYHSIYIKTSTDKTMVLEFRIVVTFGEKVED